MIRFLAAAAVMAALASCAGAGGAGPKAGAVAMPNVPPAEISEQTMRDVTRILSSDAFEGRSPGTPGEEKTLAYLVQRFKDAGLQPGNKGSWFQNVPLVEITGKEYGPLILRKGGEIRRFDYGSDWVGVSYRTDRRIELKPSELVFVGYGIVAPERGWNDYAGIDMKGKTAVILVNDPDYEAKGLKGPFNGRAMTYYGRWTYKFEEAARQGASAALIVHDTIPAAYGWNVVESSWSGPQSYAGGESDGPPPTLMNGWVQKPVAEQIFAAAGQDLALLSAAAKKPGFRPVPLGLSVSTGFDNAVRLIDSKNVIGILPGRERPGEYVLYTAHWDHLGHCTANAAGDDICNGAIDNATGTAALVALAEANRAAGPSARSQVFLAVTAEESGLIGSDYYAAYPVYPLNRTAGGVNIDALTMAGPSRDVTVIGGGKSGLDAYLAKALRDSGRYATQDPTPEKGYYYRSDHFSFAKRGVPMLYIDSGKDLVKGGRKAGEAWSADYTEHRYHGPADEFDPDWDWSGVMQDMQIYYRVGRMLAETTDWPNWRAGDEFRHIRDQSCTGADGC
jgi:Zn-dependent M28 family amino/carboxypeptidase